MEVYVVFGASYSGDTEVYPLLSSYGVKSTLAEAQKELDLIEKEILQEEDVEVEIMKEETSLIAYYDNGDIDKWEIRACIVDFKESEE